MGNRSRFRRRKSSRVAEAVGGNYPVNVQLNIVEQPDGKRLIQIALVTLWDPEAVLNLAKTLASTAGLAATGIQIAAPGAVADAYKDIVDRSGPVDLSKLRSQDGR
jgi:hypothetical protein